MELCRICGRPLSDGAAVCAHCGEQTSRKVRAGSKCLICGRPLENSAESCGYCGAVQEIIFAPPESLEPQPPEPEAEPLPEPAADAVEAPPKPKKKWKIWLLLGIGVAVALIAEAVLLWIAFRPEAETETGPEQAVANYTAILNGDESVIGKLLPDAYWDFYSESNHNTREEAQNTVLRHHRSQAVSREQSYGEHTVENLFLEKLPVGEDTLETIKTQLQERYSIDPSQVTEAWEVFLLQKLQGAQDSTESMKQLGAVKIGDGWYLVNYTKAAGTYFNVRFTCLLSTVYTVPSVWTSDSLLFSSSIVPAVTAAPE